MKILITGKNGYIASKLIEYLTAPKWQGAYDVTGISLKGNVWQSWDFSCYDVLIHTAGLAHVDIAAKGSKAYEQQKEEYDRVNHRLTAAVAQKAKTEGVRHFLFLSSIIVYGESAPAGKDKCITEHTALAPVNFYGESKALAEKALQALEEETFAVTVLRLPMVYGSGCKGNFRLLQKLAHVAVVFPKSSGRRSMLYIDNLCECIRLLANHRLSGVYCPQNKEYVNTGELLKLLRNGKMCLLPGLEPLLAWIGCRRGKLAVLVNKVFGSLRYDSTCGALPQELPYQIVTLEESIKHLQKI